MGVALHLSFLFALVLYVLSCVFYSRLIYSNSGVAKQYTGKRQSLPYNFLIAAFVVHFLAFLFWIVGNKSLPRPQFSSTLFFISLALAGSFILLNKKLLIKSFGAIIAPLTFIFLLLASILFHYPANSSGSSVGVEVSAFPDYFSLWVHIALNVFSYVAYVFAFICSAFLIIQDKIIKSKSNISWLSFFPSVAKLDKFSINSLILGFVLMSTGVFSGILYSINNSLPLNFSKLISSFILLGAYFFLLTARKFFNYKGRKFAVLSVFCFLITVCTLILSGLSGSHVS